MNKKNSKDVLTVKQYQILRKQDVDIRATEQWIKSLGLNVSTFDNLPAQVLHAQQIAHKLLTQHLNLLTAEQVQTLRNFQKLTKNPSNNRRVNLNSTYPVFNISKKIYRQIFKVRRQNTARALMASKT